MIINTPQPPYYAVIFTSIRTEGDKGYTDMSDKMNEEVQKMPGFLGFEAARNEIGITVSYWTDEKAIKKWKEHNEHAIARNLGRKIWYESYKIRVCKVEREYGWEKKKTN